MSISMQLRNMYALESSAYGLQWLGVHSLPRAMINAQTLWGDPVSSVTSREVT